MDNMTPADYMAMNRDNFFGGDGTWFMLILFLFAFGGNGYGWGGNRGGVSDAYVLNSDFATLQRQLSDGFNAQERRTDGIINGICSLGYDSLNQTAQIQQNINTNGYETRNAIVQSQFAQMQSDNMTQNAINGGFCRSMYEAQSNTRDIVENANANTKAILEAITAQTMAAKDEKIAEQEQKINMLQLTASQCAQNEYLLNRLQPTPVPTYPFQFGCGGCGCN